MIGIIYKATNTINGKSYIGQTTRSFNRRKTEHLSQAKGNHRSCAYFHSALLKYGADNFAWEILYQSNDMDKLNIKEQSYIQEYNSYGDGGYNLCLGGGSNSGYKHSEETLIKRRGYKHTEEFRKAASERMKGRIVLESTKEKIRQHNIGKKASAETKIKMSKNGKGKGTKPIKCIETNQTFSSITEASILFGTTPCCISRVVNGIRKSTCGYTFKYTEEKQ